MEYENLDNNSNPILPLMYVIIPNLNKAKSISVGFPLKLLRSRTYVKLGHRDVLHNFQLYNLSRFFQKSNQYSKQS